MKQSFAMATLLFGVTSLFAPGIMGPALGLSALGCAAGWFVSVVREANRTTERAIDERGPVK